MVELNLAQSGPIVARLLVGKESRTLDFKRIGAKHTRKLETICAFANSEGGWLILGVGDEKALSATAKPASRLFGIEENAEGFDDFRRLLMNAFAPAITALRWWRLPCTLYNGEAGHIVMLQVDKSEQVHSIVGNGTWTRMDASNRQLSAVEITDLTYRRGVRSAASEPIPIKLSLLETPVWLQFATARGIRTGTFAEQLEKIGLAKEVDSVIQPTRAAVLLFAEEPGSLLAAHETRADIRLMIYDGKAVILGATPNLRMAARTIRGPLIVQIDLATNAVMDALAQGITLQGSGFKSRHLYPRRVVTEAIVNAVIHRDYRLNRDIFIRIFDDRIEVESPGAFPGSITPSNISKVGSKARNPLIAQNLREFPLAPNIDAGEGVKMMFAEMAAAQRYPPQYRQNTENAVESVTVILLNHERPSIWDEVSHWLDTHGEITNSDLREIGKIDTLAASRMLKAWVEQGVLAQMPDRAKRNMAYVKPQQPMQQQDLLSSSSDNKL